MCVIFIICNYLYTLYMSKEDKKMENDEYDEIVDLSESELYQVMSNIFENKKGEKKNIPEEIEKIYLLMDKKLEKSNQILDKRLKNIDTSIKKLCNIVGGFVSRIGNGIEDNRIKRNSRFDSDDSDE